ncbi:hypothetical protein PVA38_12500 [Streptococcus pneumoniae D39]|nr:hypothetical protein PVA38_12500 [Streptococcus pneumoniae D39]
MYKRQKCIWGSNMFQLGDKTRIIFAIIGASCILVSMYLIPLIKTENKFWEILLFILGVLLIGICLLYTSPSPRDRTRSRMPSSA